MRRSGPAIIVVLGAVGLLLSAGWDRLTVRESGHGFLIGDRLVLGEYGYSDGGDRLRYGILRTWPKDSTPEQRLHDPRVVRDSFGWPLIRHPDGRLVPARSDGYVYYSTTTTSKPCASP